MFIQINIASSGTILSGNVGAPHLASGAVQSYHLANASVLSGTIGSGQIASGHFASGFIANLAGNITSGAIGSGLLSSGAVQGFFGATRHIASGTVGVSDFGSGAVVAGTVGSGAILSGNLASGQIGTNHVAAAGLTSGNYASGSIGSPHIAAGGVLSGNLGSGQVGSFHLADQSVGSGDIVQSIISRVHLASGAVTSGILAVGGAPDGTKLLRDDFSWVAPGSIGLVSGSVVSGIVGSGTIQGFFGATRHIASGTVGVFDFGSGAVVAGTVGSGAIVSGNVASGQIGTAHLADGAVQSGDIAAAIIASPHMASGAVTSGILAVGGTPTGSLFLRDDFTWQSAGGGLTSGAVQSGHVASGSVGGFFGVTRQVQSGTIGVFDFGSGAVIAGTVGSGAVVSGNIASGQVGTNHIAAGAVLSGNIGSGQIGTVHLGDNSVTSGDIGSGQIGQFHLTSGSVGSGTLAVGGTPTGTKVLQDDFTWVAVGAASINSGDIGSGKIASGAIQGFFGATRHIASGTVGAFDLGSGAVIAGTVSSGAIVFQNIASGAVQGASISSGAIQTFHLTANVITSGYLGSGTVWNYYQTGSGLIVPRSQGVMPYYSGLAGSLLASEPISGVRTVYVTQSGTVAIAMAGVSGRGPAVGVAAENILSGMPVNIHSYGPIQFLSGMTDFSGYVGQQLFVGRSGQVVTASGSWNSGGLLSGDITQPIGVTHNSGGGLIQIGAQPPFISALVASGDIASGQIGWPHMASGAIRSGDIGDRAVVSGSYASGSIGTHHLGDAAVKSGNIGSGEITTFHVNSGGLLSGAIGSGQIGHFHISSGAIQSGQIGMGGTPTGSLFFRDDFTWATAGGAVASGDIGSGKIASGAVQGFFGATRHVVSGTVGSFDFGSGAVIAGTVGSGAVVSGNIASGQVGQNHIASGQVTWFHGGSGATFDRAQYAMMVNSGIGRVRTIAGEPISGTRAVFVNQSGNLGIAMSSVSGRMPAVGVVPSNVASGIEVDVYSVGTIQFLSGMCDFSGYVGQMLYVGRSGHISTLSGSYNSGGLLSGDIWQPVGVAFNSGGASLGVIPTLAFVPGLITSGNIASGQVDTNHFASGAFVTYARDTIERSWTTFEPVSGGNAVALTSGNLICLAMAGSGLRLPAVGVPRTNANSGSTVDVILLGLSMTANCATWSGQQGKSLYVGSGGLIIAQGLLVSGQGWQRLGIAVSGGIVVQNSLSITSGQLETPPGNF